MKRQGYIGPVEIGHIPRVVGVIDSIVPVEEILDLARSGVDIFEIRVDCFPESVHDTLAYLKRIRQKCTVPFIGTIRETPQTKADRLESFRELIPYVDCIDIEFDADIRSRVISLAPAVPVIISEHDFSGTPEPDQLHGMCVEAFALGADIFKIATTPRTAEDTISLLLLAREFPGKIVAISMGETGKISRIAAPLFGSLLSYGFTRESVAPGQTPARELARELDRYYPQRGGSTRT